MVTKTQFSCQALPKQLLNGMAADKDFSTDIQKWQKWDDLKQTTLEKGSCELAAMTKASNNKETIANISSKFFQDMAAVEKVLKEKKPLTVDDCRSLNKQAEDLLTHIQIYESFKSSLPVNEYESYERKLDKLEAEASKAYKTLDGEWQLQLRFNDTVRKIREYLKPFKPPAAASTTYSVWDLASRASAAVASVKNYVLPGKDPEEKRDLQ